MLNSMYFSLILNIGLLVLIATLLTKLPIIRNMLLHDTHSLGSIFILSIIFGVISILSTYTGIRSHGAIVNTRVIGILAAGLLGGPYVGMGAAIIGGLHRYLFDIGGFTAISCAISTLMEGLIGSAFSRRFKIGKLGSIEIFFITALVEWGQMLIILLLSQPLEDALALVKVIGLPMILMNALGMIVFLGTFDMVFMEEDSQFAEKMRLALRIVEQCLPHLRKGFYHAADIEATADIIFHSTSCSAIMITDTQKILAIKSDSNLSALEGDAILSPILNSIHNLKPTIFDSAKKTSPLSPVLKNHIMITAPIVELDYPIGSLTMVFKKHWQTSQANFIFASELARLFSTQLELSTLDYQKNLRRKAEFKALQSQVNPHFLYNALNTVSYVLRDHPDKARKLLLDLSTYYRQTLENDFYTLHLSKEFSHITSYLNLEKARFEEKLEVEMDVENGLNCMVPAFLLQPIVENAVRYGSDQNGNRYVCISAHSRNDIVEISISDKGKGIPAKVIRQLYAGENYGGIGLANVQNRLKSIYGQDHALHILSSSNGSKVFFRIPVISESKYAEEFCSATYLKNYTRRNHYENRSH